MSINYWGINSKINSLKRYSNDLKSAKVKINDIKVDDCVIDNLDFFKLS